MGMEDDDPLPVNAALLNPSMFVGDVIAGHGVTPLLQAALAAGCKRPTATTWSKQPKTSWSNS
jgi:shikimate dehydrogenase